jgi:NAD(P)-dependent dehydrogenase (short-subunit alcohol dehydrogenase family)
MTPSTEDKVAIVTGAASGIGRATARLLSKNGVKIVLADIDETRGLLVRDELRKMKNKAIFIRTDVSRAADAKRCVEVSVKTFGRLNYLFNNAGINPMGNAIDTSEELWDQVLDINLKGMFLMSKYAIPEMKKCGGGSIVCTSSVDGLVAIPNEIAYIASKGGVISMVKSLALDFARDNIRINCICPGCIFTSLNERLFEEKPELIEPIAREHAMNRIGQAEEVAKVVLFLLSDAASYITAAILPIDGGYSAVKTGME